MLQSFIEEFYDCFFFPPAQQGAKRILISPISAMSILLCAPILLRVDVNLNDFGIARIKGADRGIAPSRISVSALHHHGAGSQKSSFVIRPVIPSAYIIRVIVLNVLFGAQGMNDWRF